MRRRRTPLLESPRGVPRDLLLNAIPSERAPCSSPQGVLYGSSMERARLADQWRHAQGFGRFGWSAMRSGTSSACPARARTTEFGAFVAGVDTPWSKPRPRLRKRSFRPGDTVAARRLDGRATALPGPEPRRFRAERVRRSTRPPVPVPVTGCTREGWGEGFHRCWGDAALISGCVLRSAVTAHGEGSPPVRSVRCESE